MDGPGLKLYMRLVDMTLLSYKIMRMSKIIPFEALLPRADIAAKVICPPYDVIESDGARAMAAGNKYSFLHVAKPEIDLPPGINQYDDVVYAKGAENLALFVKEGWLVRDAASIYIYRQILNGRPQTGVVCCVSADEYEKGGIKKHELTRKEKEDDRTRHMIETRAHAEPVMIAHRNNKEVKALVDEAVATKPLYDIEGWDGVKHTFWRAPSACAIRRAFEKIDALYIADGHHRSAGGTRVMQELRSKSPAHTGHEAYNFFPAVVYAEDELAVFEYQWAGDPAKRPLSKYTMRSIMELADKNGIMPPKSTWFAPKLASGFFVHTF